MASYRVTASAGLRVRSKPSTGSDSKVIGNLMVGTVIEGTPTNGWLKHTYGGQTGYSSMLYLSLVQDYTVNTTTTNSSGVSASDTKQNNVNSGKDTYEDANYTQDEINDIIASGQSDVNYISNFASMKNVLGCFGLPYQFLASADTRLSGTGSIRANDTGIGATYGEKIAAKIPMIFLTPGRPTFMPKFSKSDRENIISGLIRNGTGMSSQTQSLDDLLSKDGRYYTFSASPTEYYQFVNPMCRIAAKYLGLDNVRLDGCPLDMMDWKSYTLNNIFAGGNAATQYGAVPFYLDSDNSVNEGFGNSVTESSLASAVNGISDLGRELNFLTGYTSRALDQDWFNDHADTLTYIENLNSEIEGALGSGNLLSSLSKHLATVASGGKLIFPQIWASSDMTRSYNVKFKFVSPDANALSVYLNVLVPLFHLIGLVAPQTIPSNPNGYTSPFLVRAIYKSFFNVDMGIITSMDITRGGDCLWTVDGLPTSIEVDLTIKDLYDVMSITYTSSTNWKYDTMNNTAQMDYIANLCGINMYKAEIGRQLDMWATNNTVGRVADAGRDIWSRFNTSISNGLLRIWRRN